MGETIKAYKGFKKDMTCRGFQYEEEKSYHEEKAKCCDAGFHACEYPLDCFDYYAPNSSVYHEVELSGDMDYDNGDSKVCATDIKIGVRLSIAEIVKAALEFTFHRVKKEAGSDEDYGASSATGYRGASSAGHANAIAVAWGYKERTSYLQIGRETSVIRMRLTNGRLKVQKWSG